MRKINEEYSSGPLTALISRVGQCLPSVSDDVHVNISLRLPVDPGDPNARIRISLQFGERVKIGGQALVEFWGTRSPGGEYREREKKFPAPTWAQAFSDARDWAAAQAAALNAAIAAREAALAAAEEGE